MARRYTVLCNGEPVGVVVPAGEGFRFLAVRLNAFAVDGKVFTTIDAARDAVSAAVRAEHFE